MLDLTRELEGKKYHLYFDNFFSSVSLLTTLLQKGLYACGTARQNYCGFPTVLKLNGKGKKELENHGLIERGDSQIVQMGGVMALLWRDNKVVTLLSSNAQPQQHSTVQRREYTGNRTDVHCPLAMDLYNRYMGGVDKNDQLRQYYHVRLKSRKFYRYIFWFLFEVAFANAHILHTNYSGAAKKPLKEFRLQVARGLIGDYNSRRRAGRATLPPTVLQLRHFPVKFTEDPMEKTARHRCWYCHTHHNRCHDTVWYCRDC